MRQGNRIDEQVAIKSLHPAVAMPDRDGSNRPFIGLDAKERRREKNPSAVGLDPRRHVLEDDADPLLGIGVILPVFRVFLTPPAEKLCNDIPKAKILELLLSKPGGEGRRTRAPDFLGISAAGEFIERASEAAHSPGLEVCVRRGKGMKAESRHGEGRPHPEKMPRRQVTKNLRDLERILEETTAHKDPLIATLDRAIASGVIEKEAVDLGILQVKDVRAEVHPCPRPADGARGGRAADEGGPFHDGDLDAARREHPGGREPGGTRAEDDGLQRIIPASPARPPARAGPSPAESTDGIRRSLRRGRAKIETGGIQKPRLRIGS